MSFHKSLVPEIREKYALYKQLLMDRKSVSESIIIVSDVKKNQRNYYLKDVAIQHTILPDEINFAIEVKHNNYKHFSFILRCTNLSLRPFFHYDSAGVAHRNYDISTPLKYQQVLTPHFNCFNENGLSWAYQTEQLKNETERAALEDISLCVAHFCDQSNIRLDADDFPTIEMTPGTLPLDISNNDPNKGVQFL